jgi:hypothetical protein
LKARSYRSWSSCCWSVFDPKVRFKCTLVRCRHIAVREHVTKSVGIMVEGNTIHLLETRGCTLHQTVPTSTERKAGCLLEHDRLVALQDPNLRLGIDKAGHCVERSRGCGGHSCCCQWECWSICGWYRRRNFCWDYCWCGCWHVSPKVRFKCTLVCCRHIAVREHVTKSVGIVVQGNAFHLLETRGCTLGQAVPTSTERKAGSLLGQDRLVTLQDPNLRLGIHKVGHCVKRSRGSGGQ